MEDKLLYPDDHLIWYAEVDSGPRMGKTAYKRANTKDLQSGVQRGGGPD